MDIISYSKASKIASELNNVENLKGFEVYSNNISGTQLVYVTVDIKAGTYIVDIDSITSSDTDSDLNAMVFMYVGGSGYTIRVTRGNNIQTTIDLPKDVEGIYFYASDNNAHSKSDTFTFSGVRISVGYPLKYEMDILKSASIVYKTGERTFTDNNLVFIYENEIATASNASYETYEYKISSPTLFKVTCTTRGGDNYLAIVADDNGKVLKYYEKGISETNKPYHDYVLLIDIPGNVYFSSYKTGTIDIRIGSLNDNEISILFVGNSLTQDGMAYVPYLLRNYFPEVKFRFYMWYNGGYDLSQQYDDFVNDVACDIFSICENTHSWTNTSKKMSEVLSTYHFDIVCMQEYFNHKTSYTETDLADWNNCRDYIKSHYTGYNGLKFISLFHSPWMTDEAGVYNVTKAGNALILQETLAEDMISTGLALHMARSTALDSLGDAGHLTPDSIHAQEGLPCLLEAYTATLWMLEKAGVNKGIYGLPFKMTTAIYNTISVPGPNIGTGVIEGTDAQNLLAQEVAEMAYKAGKKFITDNISANDVDDGIVKVSGSTPTITGRAGTRYICGEVATLSITPPATGSIDVMFKSGSTPAVLTVPNTVQFPSWFNPSDLEANVTYEINILDGVYGAVGKWT